MVTVTVTGLELPAAYRASPVKEARIWFAPGARCWVAWRSSSIAEPFLIGADPRGVMVPSTLRAENVTLPVASAAITTAIDLIDCPGDRAVPEIWRFIAGSPLPTFTTTFAESLPA